MVAPSTVEATPNEHQAALRLLGVLPPWGGTVVTAVAIFTHAEVCVRERRRTITGKVTVGVVDGLTSLSSWAADATRLWAQSGIENGRHCTRDMTSGEDRCRVRPKQAPRVLASLRNVAVYLLPGPTSRASQPPPAPWSHNPNWSSPCSTARIQSLSSPVTPPTRLDRAPACPKVPPVPPVPPSEPRVGAGCGWV